MGGSGRGFSANWRRKAGRGGKAGQGGKRDRYDIDKMGSFGFWFGDATNSAGRSWWNGFSRFKSRRGANAVVRESGRLPSIRAGFAGYSMPANWLERVNQTDDAQELEALRRS